MQFRKFQVTYQTPRKLPGGEIGIMAMRWSYPFTYAEIKDIEGKQVPGETLSHEVAVSVSAEALIKGSYLGDMEQGDRERVIFGHARDEVQKRIKEGYKIDELLKPISFGSHHIKDWDKLARSCFHEPAGVTEIVEISPKVGFNN
jgi:hypothetical protein